MKRIYLFIGLFLMFLIIINGCTSKESKETYKTTIKEVQKPQESSVNKTTNKNQEIFNEISNTDALDSSLEELDSVE